MYRRGMILLVFSEVVVRMVVFVTSEGPEIFVSTCGAKAGRNLLPLVIVICPDQKMQMGQCGISRFAT